MDDIKIYLDSDINENKILDKKVAIIGYGSQGFGQAHNLKDSNVDVVVGCRLDGESAKKAENNGMRVLSIEDAVKWSDIVQILIPDEVQSSVYKEKIEPYLREGQYLMFSHGFNIHYKQIVAPDFVNVIMVAPKGPGHVVRSEYENNRGVPSLIAVYQDYSKDSKDVALAYARAIGSSRVGVIETTFKEETETDLFGEQAVICGGVEALVKAGFESLVEAGYSPYMAYFECFHEMKLIVDLMYQGGLSDMHYSISNTAEYGDYTRGNKVISEKSKEAMKEIIKSIQNGSFKDEFLNEMKTGSVNFKKYRQDIENHLIEKVGKKLRSLFLWSKDNKIINRTKN